MILDNTNGLSNLFEFKKNHFNSSFKQKMNLKIQILAGSTLMSRFHVAGFEIELPLVISTNSVNQNSEQITFSYLPILCR